MSAPYELWYDKNLPPYTCQCGFTFYGPTGKKLFFFKETILKLHNGIELALNASENGNRDTTSFYFINKNLSFNRERLPEIKKKQVNESRRFNDELYVTVLEVFKSLDQHIKHWVSNEHKQCLHLTRKHFFKSTRENSCEISTAYLVWRNTLLLNNHRFEFDPSC